MGHLKDLRDEIRKRLDGLEARQAQREAARDFARRGKTVSRARRDGLLGHLEPARECLLGFKVEWTEEKVYGMTIIATNTGNRLFYRPNGELDKRPEVHHADFVQEEMFPELLPAPEEPPTAEMFA